MSIEPPPKFNSKRANEARESPRVTISAARARIMPSVTVGRLICRNGWWRHVGLWLPPLVYMAVIFHLSSESDPLPMLTQYVWDKALHCLEYGGLAFLLCRALLGEGFGWTAALALALVATSGYGASDEWHQLYTPGRSSDVRDWMADTFGAAVGLASYVLVASTGLILRARPRVSPRFKSDSPPH